MPQTLAQLVAQAEQANRGQLDDRTPAEDIVNDAGHFMCGMHQWKFLHRPSLSVDFTAGLSQITMPRDMGRLIGADTDNNYVRTVNVVTMDYINWLRGNVASEFFDYYVALVHPSQAHRQANSPNPVLEVYPTPDSTTTGAIVINYQAGWTTLVDLDDVANVPPEMELLLKEMVRAVTLGMNDDAKGATTTIERLDKIVKSQVFKDAKEADGLRQAKFGRMRGGRVSATGRGQEYWHNSISNLSS